MSKERELLKRFMIELTTEEDVVSLFNDIKECLAKPEQDDLTPSSTKLQDRIKDYLSMGGLFNPELANHGAVRDLILDARAELDLKREPNLIGYVADPSVGFDVSRSVQGMPLIWLGKLEYGDKLYRVGVDDEHR